MEFHWNALSYLAGVAARSLGLATVAWAAMVLTRVKSPATRHAVWTAVTAGMLAMAAASSMLPELPVRVWRARLAVPPPLLRVTPQATPQSARVPVPVMSIAAPATPESWPLPWDIVVAGLYFAGLLLFAGRLAYAWLLTRRLVRTSRLAPRFGGESVYESACIAVPLTVGWIRPKILLPIGWNTWPPEKLHAVLVHERTHAARADWAIAVLAGVNRCVFWFHPLAWWIERQLTVLAEQACDDASLSQVSSRECYAQALVEMAAAVRSAEGRVFWEAMAMAKAAEVRVRVERILDEGRQIFPGVTRARWFAVVACGLPLVYLAAVARPARVRAQPVEPVPVTAALDPAQEPAPLPPSDGTNPEAMEEARKAVQEQLERLNREVARFKVENTGNLPDHFQDNVAQLNTYQMALAVANESLNRLHQQILQIETQIQNNTTNLNAYRSLSGDRASPEGGEILTQLNQRIAALRSEIATLAQTLTPNHPQLRSAQANLATLEREYAEREKEAVNPRTSKAMLDLTASNNLLQAEMGNLNLRLNEKVRQTQELNRAIASYQSRIESSARLEQQYAELLFARDVALQQAGELSRVNPAASGPGLISRRDPEYTAAAKQARIQGAVELSVTIGTDGVARDIHVIHGLEEGLDRKAIECVKTWRFRPASRNGRPVTAFASVEVKFRLD